MADRRCVLVVGGGAAGLMAAIATARGGAVVTVLERMPEPGRKILATGGGRCNLTNMLPVPEFLARFERRAGRFIRPAVYGFDAEALRRFLADLGMPTQCPDGFHVYPVSESAKDVRDALVGECERLGVEIRTGVDATGLIVEDEKVSGVAAGDGEFRADHVILTTGGCAWPALGSNGSGFALARAAGHRIVVPVPALVPLVTREEWPGRCAGVSIRGARVRLDRKGASKEGVTGDVLFTHRGISGPAVLDMSRDVARLLAEGEGSVGVVLHLTDEPNPERWRERIAGWARQHPRRLVRNLVAEALPQALAEAFCGEATIADDTQVAQLPREGARRLGETLAGARVEVTGTEGATRAMVTSGGVDTREVDPKTLRSRKADGLSFAGEVLDVDGPCGGFNLQWAFSSGWLAGEVAGRSGGDR